jgi:hypothetical protein
MLAEHFLVQLGFGREVAVHGAGPDAGPAGYLVERGTGAKLREHLSGGLKH